jgi:hypothetical protein
LKWLPIRTQIWIGRIWQVMPITLIHNTAFAAIGIGFNLLLAYIRKVGNCFTESKQEEREVDFMVLLGYRVIGANLAT